MARLISRTALVIALVVGICATAEAQQDLPTLSGPVTDLAQVIDPQSAAELDRASRALLASTGDVVVVVTVPSLGSFGSIEDYATRLFERAGIGDREKDNGVLVLLALAERRVRIEVGYGLEEFITDGFSGDTIRTYMLPAFRRDAYGEGLLAGTQAIIARIAERRGATIDVEAPPTQPQADENYGFQASPGGIKMFVLALAIFILISYINNTYGGGGSGLRRGGRRGTWSGWHGGVGGFGGGFGSGGFSGGGFGGFSGGSSGGGGASGGW